MIASDSFGKVDEQINNSAISVSKSIIHFSYLVALWGEMKLESDTYCSC